MMKFESKLAKDLFGEENVIRKVDARSRLTGIICSIMGLVILIGYIFDKIEPSIFMTCLFAICIIGGIAHFFDRPYHLIKARDLIVKEFNSKGLIIENPATNTTCKIKKGSFGVIEKEPQEKTVVHFGTGLIRCLTPRLLIGDDFKASFVSEK